MVKNIDCLILLINQLNFNKQPNAGDKILDQG